MTKQAHHSAAFESTAETRPLTIALMRGWHKHCPSCGGGQLYESYLQVRETCVSCGEPLHHHRADDLPAWMTIVVVGHLLVGLLLSVETAFSPPLWIHFSVWPSLTVAMTLWLLPRVKGMVVGMQWAWRMHGFDHD